MSQCPEELKYTKSHEWVRREKDGTLTIGITDFAQHSLGDLVFVDLPPVNSNLQQGDDAAVVESVKTAADVYSPVNGKVIAVNDALTNAPEKVNQEPYGNGWLFRLQPGDATEVDHLMDAASYSAKISQE